MSFVLWVMILAIVTAVTCALPGIWLVLRKQSMLTDAISHAVLPGIVIAAVATGTIQSPWSIVGAAVMGTVVVLGAELLESTGLVSGDGPQGLVFPALFSIGVLLLSTRFSGVQITESAVLVGDLNLAAFLPLKIGNTLLGPQYLWVMAGVLVLNVVYLTVLHTRLKLIAFDPELAQTMGIPVKRLGHLTMLVVSGDDHRRLQRGGRGAGDGADDRPCGHRAAAVPQHPRHVPHHRRRHRRLFGGGILGRIRPRRLHLIGSGVLLRDRLPGGGGRDGDHAEAPHSAHRLSRNHSWKLVEPGREHQRTGRLSQLW